MYTVMRGLLISAFYSSLCFTPPFVSSITCCSTQCSYLLTLRVLAEPSLLKRIEQLGDTHNAVFPIGRSPAFSSHRGTMQPAASANAPGSWEVLRVPVFDMLNCIFAK